MKEAVSCACEGEKPTKAERARLQSQIPRSPSRLDLWWEKAI